MVVCFVHYPSISSHYTIVLIAQPAKDAARNFDLKLTVCAKLPSELRNPHFKLASFPSNSNKCTNSSDFKRSNPMCFSTFARTDSTRIRIKFQAFDCWLTTASSSLSASGLAAQLPRKRPRGGSERGRLSRCECLDARTSSAGRESFHTRNCRAGVRRGVYEGASPASARAATEVWPKRARRRSSRPREGRVECGKVRVRSLEVLPRALR